MVALPHLPNAWQNPQHHPGCGNSSVLNEVVLNADLIAQRDRQKDRYFQRIFIAMVANLKCFRATLGQTRD